MTNRRVFSLNKKKQIIEEHCINGLSISALSRKYGIHSVTLYSWKRSIMNDKNTKSELTSEELADAFKKIDEQEKKIKYLEKIVADKAIENAILQESVDTALKKNRREAARKLQKKLKRKRSGK